MPQRSARELLMRQSPRKDGADWFRIENMAESDTAKIFIYDEIGFWGTTAQDFVMQLASIPQNKIELHLNSPGGEIFDGVAIYNALKGHHATVDVYVDALAASAASFIAQAGDNVFMARSATMMIHDGLAMVYGNAQDMQDTAVLLDKLSNTIADIYAQRAGGTVEDWRAFMKEETWYNAQEAVDAKLADEVITVEAAPAPANKSELISLFNYSGRNNAPSPESVRAKVLNRVKEARMSVQPGAPQSEGQPEGQEPEGQQPEGQEPGEQQPSGAEPSGPGESGTVPEVPTGAPSATANPQNAAVGVLINGVRVTDSAAIQAHINALEGAAKETKMENRKAFVKSLADSNKITAVQMTQWEAFVTDEDLTDKQYQSWVASWEAAPGLSLLGEHAAGGQGAQQTPAEAKANSDLETAKAIVRRHVLSNMPEDQIKKTDSYKAVIAADPDFKL